MSCINTIDLLYEIIKQAIEGFFVFCVVVLLCKAKWYMSIIKYYPIVGAVDSVRVVAPVVPVLWIGLKKISKGYIYTPMCSAFV